MRVGTCTCERSTSDCMNVVSDGRGVCCEVREAASCGGVAGGVGGNSRLAVEGCSLQRMTAEALWARWATISCETGSMTK